MIILTERFLKESHRCLSREFKPTPQVLSEVDGGANRPAEVCELLRERTASAGTFFESEKMLYHSPAERSRAPFPTRSPSSQTSRREPWRRGRSPKRLDERRAIPSRSGRERSRLCELELLRERTPGRMRRRSQTGRGGRVEVESQRIVREKRSRAPVTYEKKR